ncbi:MAG: hypothetical protein GWM98_27390, partial [Nitrospinaceae bacterium]|nr:hypothetical protein [Nitrospinaceae bacterium]NIR57498.1 hypothetical protein [Nitrospinaceae bacterium]NIS87968.1 hypothetical protein [Nitrospinaceae bacterium]NIT84833.1 hypothetical protein [Nitrospinaceae bacterium]NIU47013.1 hypothetical protein [Nitrospinaceae bacterium]
MFVFDPMTQGLEMLAQRDLQKAENLFLRIINDPYAQKEELVKARHYLNDIRDCQAGVKTLDFDSYRRVVKKEDVSLDKVLQVLEEIYFLPIQTYPEFDRAIDDKIPNVIGRIKQIKIRDILARDDLFEKIEKEGIQRIQKTLDKKKSNGEAVSSFDIYRWKTLYRKFIEQINPLLLERHLELLEYILETGEIQLLDDPKLTILTPKYRWIIENTLKIKWYLLRSYFFKAKSEIQAQFRKKEGTRKYWEEVKYKKIRIFESCGFSESNIQKFLYIDKLNYKTLEEIYEFARQYGLTLIPRDVSLALRGVNKAKDHIKERGGFLMGTRKQFQDQLVALGFSPDNSYKIARQAKRSNNHQISDAFRLALQVAEEEIYWYRIPSQSEKLKRDIETQCLKHLSTVRIHLFERGRLNKLLLQSGKPLIRRYLIQIYGPNVVNLHCYFRLETIHQYYKLKFFQYHAQHVPSVSELIKISRKEFQPILLEGYRGFLKKKRLNIPQSLYEALTRHQSVTGWEDPYTTPEEKLLLKFWFLLD